MKALYFWKLCVLLSWIALN